MRRLFPLIGLVALLAVLTANAQETPRPYFLPLVMVSGEPTLRMAVAQIDDWQMCRDTQIFTPGLQLAVFDVATDDQAYPRLLCAHDTNRGVLRGRARYDSAGIWFTMPETDSDGYSAMRLVPSRPLSLTITVSDTIQSTRVAFPPVEECTPAYRDVCLPAGEDINCPEAGYRDIKLTTPGIDPYDLDADKDGYGCESR